MAKEQQVVPTLRDVAHAALEIDADGGDDPVAWGRLIARAKVVAAKRGRRDFASPAVKGGVGCRQ